MKLKLYSLFLSVILLSSATLLANVVTIKGYVKFGNGAVAANYPVKIAVYLANSATSCSEVLVVTNSSGFYTRDLTCTGDIKRSRISLKNCDSSVMVSEKEIPSSKIVEANFTICQSKPVVCHANFTAENKTASSTIPAFSITFNSSGSEVQTGDKIIHRSWDFHDGSPLLNDRVDPLHSFPHAGNYEVCLSIKTEKGCESKICKVVTVAPGSATSCQAKFSFEKLGPKKFRFNSEGSNATNDNIVERTWDFRDSGMSKDISPAHEFKRPGNYEVCLRIRTAKGCESRFCAVVKVEESVGEKNAEIEIISLHPSPVHENLKPVIFSKQNNIAAIISILNAEGIVKYTKKVNLLQGYNPFEIQVLNLPPGSYYFNISTRFGVISKRFFKI